jgi:hypothetical protein
MDAVANKRLVVRFYEEVWARGNVGFAGEVFADDDVRHDLRPTQPAPGAAGQAKIAEQTAQGTRTRPRERALRGRSVHTRGGVLPRTWKRILRVAGAARSAETMR